jgi:hypothetical protein
MGNGRNGKYIEISGNVQADEWLKRRIQNGISVSLRNCRQLLTLQKVFIEE